MWRDHASNKRNRITERTVGMGIGGNREKRGGGGRRFDKI